MIHRIHTDQIDALLGKPYWVVDLLPYQVPADGEGQFFRIEQYVLNSPLCAEVCRKHRNILLKLNCYYDLYAAEGSDEEWMKNPDPEKLSELVCRKTKYLMIRLAEDTLIILNDCGMTVYNPDQKVLECIRLLAAAEGLFVWQPSQE